MWLGIILAVLLRIVLYVLGAPALLDGQVLFDTPITSIVGIREGIFLMTAGTNPYAGGTCHHPPLVMFAFHALRHLPEAAFFGIVVLLDVIVALLLKHAASQYMSAKARAGRPFREATSYYKDDDDEPFSASEATLVSIEDVVSPSFVGLSYLVNPFVIGGCLVCSFQNLQHVAVMATVCFAASGKGGLAAGALAFALYICPWTPLVLLLPLAYLAFAQRPQCYEHDQKTAETFVYTRSKETQVLEVGFIVYLVKFVLVVGLLFT